MNVTSEIDLGPVEEILVLYAASRHGENRGNATDELIPLLQQVQAAYGYLPASVLEYMSGRIGVPTSRIFGVATFYAQFHLEPHGKHTITLCRGTSCHVRGGKRALDTVKSLLGVEDGETTEDGLFSLETVACLGACALAPAMIVDGKYYGKLTPRGAERIVRQMMPEEGS